MVKVLHAHELLQGPYGNSLWKVQNRLYLGRKGRGPLLCEAMIQKVDGSRTKLALCRVYNQPMPAEMLEQGLELGQVLLHRGACHQDVIQIDGKERQVM